MKSINKIKQTIKVLIVATAVVSFSSCATILSGTKDMVTFKSNVDNASVYMNGKEIGKTNNSIEVKRSAKNEKAIIAYRKDGYEDATFEFQIKTAGAYWINMPFFLAGVLPGLTFSLIDMATGAPYKSKYPEYSKTMTPKNSTK